MLIIWGRLSSINVRKVVMTAQQLGIAFERREAGGAHGVVKTDAFVALNPNSTIPVIQDGDYTLWESNVIVRYLCAKHSHGDLYPADLQQQFDAERWMDWQQTTANPAGRNAFFQLIRTPEAERQSALIEASCEAMHAVLLRLEAHLGGRNFVATERLSMADIVLACEVHRWFNLPFEAKQARPSYPNIERWYAPIAAIEAAKGALDLPLS